MEDETTLLADEEFYKQLLLAEQQKHIGNVTPDSQQFVPIPGFVVKLRNNKDEKVFVNVCTAEKVPAPKEISEAELVKLLESVDATRYRVPMSLGEPHAEVDNRGQGCTAYDVVINPKFYSKIQSSELFKDFFLTIVFEGLESKYEMELERNWTVLKNKKCMGVLQPHYIRSKSKPVIMEMEKREETSHTVEAAAKRPIIEELKAEETRQNYKAPVPKYTIIREPPDGQPDFLVIEISLPGVKSTKNSTLDVGDDRLILHVDPDKYHLNLGLPFDVDNDTCAAQFNRKTKILTLTMPVVCRS